MFKTYFGDSFPKSGADNLAFTECNYDVCFLFYDELIIQLNIASIYVNLSFRFSFPFSFMISAFFGTIEVSNYYINFL